MVLQELVWGCRLGVPAVGHVGSHDTDRTAPQAGRLQADRGALRDPLSVQPNEGQGLRGSPRALL